MPVAVKTKKTGQRHIQKTIERGAPPARPSAHPALIFQGKELRINAEQHARLLGKYTDWKPTNEYMELLADYGKRVPDEAVMEFCIGGTPEECIDKIKEFVGAGVQHFVFEIVGPDHRGMVERIGKEITPCFAD